MSGKQIILFRLAVVTLVIKDDRVWGGDHGWYGCNDAEDKNSKKNLGGLLRVRNRIYCVRSVKKYLPLVRVDRLYGSWARVGCFARMDIGRANAPRVGLAVVATSAAVDGSNIRERILQPAIASPGIGQSSGYVGKGNSTA